MLKAKKKIMSVFVAFCTLVLTVILGVSALVVPAHANVTANAATTEVVFELGDNGSASHSDGSSKTSYTETDGDYTLTLTATQQFYTGARDAKGNSCIKLGSSSKVGGFSFTAPDDVTKVVIGVAGYKATAAKISVNSGATQTISTLSNNGEYTAIEVDTSSTKKVNFTTVSGGVRAMVNTITYVIESDSSEPTCGHANQTTTTVDATCTEAGSTTVTCDDCGETISTETFEATGHNYQDKTIDVEATCIESGSKTVVCQNCNDEETKEIPAKGHDYQDGFCDNCGEEQPSSLTIIFDDTAKRTEFSTAQQVWVENGITVTNKKGSSTSNVADYSNPVRFYKSSELIVACANMSKIEFACNTAAYATALANSIGDNATAEDKVVTVVLGSAQDEFSVTLGGQVRVDSITVTTISGENEECAHNYTSEVTAPSCTEAGFTTHTCSICFHTYTDNEVEALGHNYVEGYCETCGEQDPASIDYSGYYYISFTHSETVYYTDNSQLSSNRYYARTEAPATEAVETKYVYRLAKTATGIYSIYEFDGDCYQEDVTVEKVGDVYRFYATVDGEAYQFLLNAGSDTKYIKFYKASNATQTNYAQDITLTKIELAANMDSASITLGEDIAMNYYVTMNDAFADAKMYFTVEGETFDMAGKKGEDGRYVFSLSNLAPQYMTTNIKAVLVYGDVELDKIENYSIKTYAQDMLNKAESSAELKQLLTDLLYYGAAAQNYKDYNTSDLATSDVENLGTASTATPEETEVKPVNATLPEGVASYGAWFTGVGVRFENVNKLYVKISTTENVTLTIDGVAVEVTGTTIYTDGILATGFDDEYTFELYYGDTLMQTLTYSVNAFAYTMQDNEEKGELALALYRYGVSAEAYAATNN